MVNRRRMTFWLLAGACMMAASAHAAAAEEAPDALIQRLAIEAMDAVKAAPADARDTHQLMALVDRQIMPHVNFVRMTASVVGRSWRDANAEQQARLQEEFKALLVRTYAGALGQIKDQTVSVKPLRAGAGDTDVVVRTLVKGGGDPISIDYRLEKGSAGWKIVDLNVMGVWLVPTYRSQFAAELGNRGVDGLISALAERNRLVANAH